MKNPPRIARRAAGRAALAATLAAALALAHPAPSRAQSAYPDHTIHLVVASAAGGANDLIARLLAPHLAAALGGGASVVIDNRPGADGIVGIGYLQHAAPDGYTLAMAAASPMVLVPVTYANPPFDPPHDFVGASTFAVAPLMLVVNPALPVHSLAELIAYARANPGKLRFASAGNGGIVGVMLALFKLTTAIDVTAVNYKSSAVGMTDLLADRTDATLAIFSLLAPMVKQGQLRALAMTGETRSPLLPDVPTAKELGYPQLTGGDWYAVAGPAHLPQAIATKLNHAILTAAADPAVQKTLTDNGYQTITQPTPAAYAAFLTAETTRWSAVVKAAGIKPQ